MMKGRQPSMGGFSTIEIVISILALAVIVTGAAAAIISCGRIQRASDRKQQAAFHANQLREILKGYSIATTGGLNPSSEDLQTLHEAKLGFLGCSGLPSPACAKLPGDGCGRWALDTSCEHDADALLPAELRAPPYEAKLRYRVSAVGADGADRKVDISMTWEEPQ